MNHIKYAKPLRFPPVDGKFLAKNEKYMTFAQARFLLSGNTLVEEKLDGKFSRFESKEFAVFAEDMKRVHSIRYRVPARYAIFDIYDKKRGLYLDNYGKTSVYKDIKNYSLRIKGLDGSSFFMAPLISSGKHELAALPLLAGISKYAIDSHGKHGSIYMEGIVVKQDRELFPEEMLSGKLVRIEFFKRIKQHYRRLPMRLNIIDPMAAGILA